MSDEEKKEDKSYLTGRLLLAMPAMGDPRFHKAVIYMCAHDENGAMGLVINHALPGIDLSQLIEQLNIETGTSKTMDKPVMSGGPVETARGFVLHTTDFEQSDTIRIDEKFSVTGTIDALKAIANGDGPKKMLFILGYAGWGAGQLDQEIAQNAWLVADPDPDLIFKASPDEKWTKAVQKLGVDPGMLSGEVGRA
jgi:putative transcriptional regulator